MKIFYFQWQRACAVRRRVRALLGDTDSFHGDKVWSTKKLMIWCRANSYTPLDTGEDINVVYIELPFRTQSINYDNFAVSHYILVKQTKVTC